MLSSSEVLKAKVSSSRRYSASHNGIDFPVPLGTPVISRFSGKVVTNGTNGGFETDTNPNTGSDFGNYVVVAYDNLPLQGWYAHLSRFNLKAGRKVNKGDVIGFSGNTGFVQGVAGGFHLHYSESAKASTLWADPDKTKGGEDEMDFFDLANTVSVGFRGKPATVAEIKALEKLCGGKANSTFLNWTQENWRNPIWIKRSDVSNTGGKVIKPSDIAQIILK